MRSRLLTLSLSALLALGLVACSDTTDDGLADDPAVEAPANDGAAIDSGAGAGADAGVDDTGAIPPTTPDAVAPTE